MDAVDFSTWWSEFLSESRVRGARDGGHDAVDELRCYVAGLSPELRSAFVDELAMKACAQTEGWGLALSTLERTVDRKALTRIADHVSTIGEPKDIEGQSAHSAFLRVLAGSPDPVHRDLIVQYLLRAPIGLYWCSVPWSLWPDDHVLFASAWARYFSTIPAKHWRDTAVVQAFLSKPDALVSVRDTLLAVDERAWRALRSAMLRQTDAPWLNSEQRDRLRLACER